MAVSVIDYWAKRMFLREDLLVFGWMGMEREAREAGLRTGTRTLNTTQKKSSEEGQGKKWPDRVSGTIFLSSTVNLKEFVDKGFWDLRPNGLDLY